MWSIQESKAVYLPLSENKLYLVESWDKPYRHPTRITLTCIPLLNILLLNMYLLLGHSHLNILNKMEISVDSSFLLL